jgi:uncharacterized protein (DUF302 family)
MSEETGYEIRMNINSYDQALERIIAALKAEGFGVLPHIDGRATLKEKLGEDFRPYTIKAVATEARTRLARVAKSLLEG